ncbi:WXG100 family type VII secretion target [Nocardia sp. BMG111209]|uniref:WXG100 family type VII secretion target n=1 Tax=Nocardia sp. BMG111209 TaxID=1160137 RepID=UPI00036B6979|nr:WXG100 family type VII secretion target [Nocardia sp. BMG111209]
MTGEATGEIFHNFSAVDTHSIDIQATAGKILTAIEELKDKVTSVAGTDWDGSANDAFNALHSKWQDRSNQLQETLRKLGATVQEGNAHMQSTDNGNAQIFMGA